MILSFFKIKYSVNHKTRKILGADISFLPQLEARRIKFSDKGVQKDVLEILKDHGFNYIRLKLFVDLQNGSGYSPKKGFLRFAPYFGDGQKN